MSRIIKNVIDNAIGYNTKEAVLFHNDSTLDIKVAELFKYKFYIFSPHKHPNNFHLIENDQINRDISIRPSFVLNTFIGHFQNAHNLSKVLKIPIINIIDNLGGCKKEGIFTVAPSLEENINFCFDQKIADQLYISKYHLIKQIEEIPIIFKKELKIWKPM